MELLHKIKDASNGPEQAKRKVRRRLHVWPRGLGGTCKGDLEERRHRDRRAHRLRAYSAIT